MIEKGQGKLLAAAFLAYAIVFGLFVFFEQPGLGIGHGFYVPIVLAAMATGAVAGIIAGIVATVLYSLGVILSPDVPPSELPTLSTAIRLLTFVMVGGLTGYFAATNRRLMGGALSLVDELSVLARRDPTTQLPNVRGFEAAITRRLESRQRFALMIADVSGLAEPTTPIAVEERMQLLQQLGERLARHSGRNAEAARVGPMQFALLLDDIPSETARDVADELERLLAADGFLLTIGWALFPIDGENALSLYRAADERLFARKVVRGDWTPPP
jgi:GGDEF domain-containing protein